MKLSDKLIAATLEAHREISYSSLGKQCKNYDRIVMLKIYEKMGMKRSFREIKETLLSLLGFRTTNEKIVRKAMTAYKVNSAVELINRYRQMGTPDLLEDFSILIDLKQTFPQFTHEEIFYMLKNHDRSLKIFSEIYPNPKSCLKKIHECIESEKNATHVQIIKMLIGEIKVNLEALDHLVLIDHYDNHDTLPPFCVKQIYECLKGQLRLIHGDNTRISRKHLELMLKEHPALKQAVHDVCETMRPIYDAHWLRLAAT